MYMGWYHLCCKLLTINRLITNTPVCTTTSGTTTCVHEAKSRDATYACSVKYMTREAKCSTDHSQTIRWCGKQIKYAFFDI